MKRTACIVGVLALLVLAGCATVTIYVTFPEEKVKKAGDTLEQMYEGTPKPSSCLPSGTFLSFLCPPACAASAGWGACACGHAT